MYEKRFSNLENLFYLVIVFFWCIFFVFFDSECCYFFIVGEGSGVSSVVGLDFNRKIKKLWRNGERKINERDRD